MAADLKREKSDFKSLILDISMRNFFSRHDFFDYLERFVVNICLSFIAYYLLAINVKSAHSTLLHCEYRVGILNVMRGLKHCENSLTNS